MATWLKFTECSDGQVRWGSNSDPRGVLKLGGIYKQTREEVHSWHTKVWVEVGEGRDERGPYNSVCFQEVRPVKDEPCPECRRAYPYGDPRGFFGRPCYECEARRAGREP